MEAAKINRMKGIKKTFICEVDQNRAKIIRILIFVLLPHERRKIKNSCYMLYLFCLN